MKTGRTLQELATELDRQNKTKKDYLAKTTALELYPLQSGGVKLGGINGGMTVRSIAHQHIASHTGIPKVYYDRLLADAPDLLAENVNHWFSSNPTNRLVRTLDSSVRAFLSDSYRPLDNYDLAEAVLPRLQKLNAHVVSAEVTENRFYLKAITDKISGEVKQGDLIQAGLVISNSEVGQGSLRVEAMDYRLICTNGMIRESAVRKAHLGRSGSRGQDAIEDAREFFRDETRQADDRAFFLKVQDAVTAMFDAKTFNLRLNQYREAAEIVIDADPVESVREISTQLKLTDGEQKGVLAHLIRGSDLSVWGMANAVTRTAADSEDYDRATELESAGAKVLEMPRSVWGK